MYYTDGSGSISAISLDGANRTSPLKQLKKYFFSYYIPYFLVPKRGLEPPHPCEY